MLKPPSGYEPVFDDLFQAAIGLQSSPAWSFDSRIARHHLEHLRHFRVSIVQDSRRKNWVDKMNGFIDEHNRSARASKLPELPTLDQAIGAICAFAGVPEKQETIRALSDRAQDLNRVLDFLFREINRRLEDAKQAHIYDLCGISNKKSTDVANAA
jgi:hypothetical protein